MTSTRTSVVGRVALGGGEIGHGRLEAAPQQAPGPTGFDLQADHRGDDQWLAGRVRRAASAEAGRSAERVGS